MMRGALPRKDKSAPIGAALGLCLDLKGNSEVVPQQVGFGDSKPVSRQ